MVRAFTESGGGPSATFSLVLFSVVVATLSMAADAVPRYSRDAFLAGLALTVVLAFAAGRIVHALRTSRWRLVAALLLPTAFGAVIGVAVQALVLADVGTDWAIRDLGGLVSTRDRGPWLMSGVVLGGLPALAAATFLLLAGRAIRAVRGHDASERFGVAFTGGAGLLAALGLLFSEDLAAPPLYAVGAASAIALVVTLLVDGARARFLRRVYAGAEDAFQIVPASRFADDPSLAPVVAKAGGGAVLVRVQRAGSYRANAAQPIALLGDSEDATLRPILHRRQTAWALLAAIAGLSALAPLLHG